MTEKELDSQIQELKIVSSVEDSRIKHLEAQRVEGDTYTENAIAEAKLRKQHAVSQIENLQEHEKDTYIDTSTKANVERYSVSDKRVGTIKGVTYFDDAGTERYLSDDAEVTHLDVSEAQAAQANADLAQSQLEVNGGKPLIYDYQTMSDIAERNNMTIDEVKQAIRIINHDEDRSIMNDIHDNADRIHSTEIGLTDPNAPASGYMTWYFKNDIVQHNPEQAVNAQPKYNTNVAKSLEEAAKHPEGVANTTFNIDAGTVIDDGAAAASYAADLKNGEINHIFHNSFYQYDAVPSWSFAVEFIPLCMSDPQFTKIFTFEDSKTLTKAIQKITANEKTINVQNLNYLGMQHPFFTKLAQSHGDLQITFAEDEFFTITTIMKNVLKYASFLPNFPTNQVYEAVDGPFGDEIIAHAADDDIAPQYRLNATDMSVDDIHISSLIHDNKFVFDIVLKIYKADNSHIFGDDIAPPGFVYHFHKCWLKNIAAMDLNYDSDNMIDRSVVFSYQYMSGVPYYVYQSRHDVSNDAALDQISQTNAAVKEMVNESNASTSKSPAQMTPEGAAQWQQSMVDQTNAQGARIDAAKAAQYAGMHRNGR